MVTAMLLAICAILSFIGAKTTYYILKILAGFSWFGIFAWLTYNPFTTQGSPADVITLLVVSITGIAFMFFAFWSPQVKNGQERGGRFRFPFQPSEEDEEVERQRNYMPTRAERNANYRNRANSALRGERRRRY